jgi:hypothetical protein
MFGTLLVGAGILACALAALGLISPVWLRRLAAWSLARAMYLECIRAERQRCREIAEDHRQSWLREFGVAEAKADA